MIEENTIHVRDACEVAKELADQSGIRMSQAKLFVDLAVQLAEGAEFGTEDPEVSIYISPKGVDIHSIHQDRGPAFCGRIYPKAKGNA